MRRISGRIALICLAALLVLSMSVAASPKAARTKVQVISWWDFTNSRPLIDLKAKFDELNPDLELDYIRIGTKYADKMLVMIAGGADLPDVMMIAMDKLPIFADKGAIMKLDKYIESDYKAEMAKLYPVVADALTVKGSYYAMPRDITSKVMFFNKQLFAEAAWPFPARLDLGRFQGACQEVDARY